jgi:hypothetical protein
MHSRHAFPPQAFLYLDSGFKVLNPFLYKEVMPNSYCTHTASVKGQRKAQQSLRTKKRKLGRQQAYLYDVLGCPLNLFQAFQDHFFIGGDVQLVGFQVFDLLLYSVGGENASGDNTTACTPPLQQCCGNIMNDDG